MIAESQLCEAIIAQVPQEILLKLLNLIEGDHDAEKFIAAMEVHMKRFNLKTEPDREVTKHNAPKVANDQGNHDPKGNNFPPRPNGRPNGNHQYPKFNGYRGPAQFASVNYATEAIIPCLFCPKDPHPHRSIACPKPLKLKMQSVENHRCQRCMRLKAPGHQCTGLKPCYHCQKDHHSWLCTEKK